MAHALHPNYADKHDPDLAPRLGSGLVLKHNVNQRYATTSISATLFRLAVGGYKHHHTWVAGWTVAEGCEPRGMWPPPSDKLFRWAHWVGLQQGMQAVTAEPAPPALSITVLRYRWVSRQSRWQCLCLCCLAVWSVPKRRKTSAWHVS